MGRAPTRKSRLRRAGLRLVAALWLLVVLLPAVKVLGLRLHAVRRMALERAAAAVEAATAIRARLNDGSIELLLPPQGRRRLAGVDAIDLDLRITTAEGVNPAVAPRLELATTSCRRPPLRRRRLRSARPDSPVVAELRFGSIRRLFEPSRPYSMTCEPPPGIA